MQDLNPVQVGLLGLGTVGGGTIQVLRRNRDEITRRAGRAIEVTRAAARDLDKPRGLPLDGIAITSDPLTVVNDPEIRIVVELIGGVEPARTLVLKAIANGKHVVTANKALIAIHGNEVFQAAQERGVMVAFEAAVCGGIPIIKAIREGLAGNRIEWLAGIINGTGNFILTEMLDKSRDFETVLREAQRLGYAESDPAFDVEGIDAAHKLTILAAIAFGIPLQFDKVYTEGISQITQSDIDYAEQLGYRIKHLGIARDAGDAIELRVHPTLVPQRQLLANVMGVMNAVLIKGRCRRPDFVLRGRCRRRADGLGGGGRSRGRGAHAHLRSGEPRTASGLSTGRPVEPARGSHGRCRHGLLLAHARGGSAGRLGGHHAHLR